MLNGPRAAICGLLVTASVMSAGTVAAQARAPRAVGPTAGVMAGINAAGSTWSGGGSGPALSLNVEVPAAPTYRARLTLGTTRWTPGNDPLEAGRAAGRVSLSHLTLSAIRRSFEPTSRYPIGLYAGAGVGFYRYGIKEGEFDDRNHWGLHGLAGVDFARPGSGLAFRLEFQVHATGGPGHPQVWAVLVPAVSACVGMSKRF